MKKKILFPIVFLCALLAFVLVFFTIRQYQSNQQVAREWQTMPNNAPVLTSTTHLEIIPLYEAAGNADQFSIGHGVSYLIHTDSGSVLLDAGFNPENSETVPFAQNMQTLGISWEEIQAVLISHRHPDHVGGMDAWNNHTLNLGDIPSSLPVYTPVGMKFPGVAVSRDPFLLTTDIATTGAISYPEVFPLSLLDPKGSEQALVIHVAGHGLVLITGCGHPTLEKLVSRAEALYGESVIGVIGGLHLMNATASELQPQIKFLQARQPQWIVLSTHDSGPAALDAFQVTFPHVYQILEVGESILIP